MTDFSAEMFETESVVLADRFVCGLVDSIEGRVYQDFTVVPMSGRSENILRGRGDVITRFNNFIVESLQTVGPISNRDRMASFVHNMATVDRMIALIAIRRVTHGDKYQMEIKLPSDADLADFPTGIKRYTVDLSTLERKYMEKPEERKRVDRISVSLNPQNEVATPAEYEVGWHVMGGDDERWLEEIKDATKQSDDAVLEVLCRLDSLARIMPDGTRKEVEVKRGAYDPKSRMINAALKNSLTFMRQMPARMLRAIRDVIDDHEGDVDMMLEFKYAKPKGEEGIFRGRLDPTQKEFFFPRAISPNST